MASETGSGTLTATGHNGAETDLYEVSAADKTYVILVDLTNMDDGDEVLLRTYEKILSTTGAYVQIGDAAAYAHDRVGAAVGGPNVAVHSLKYTLEQIAGTNRDFPYSVREV